MVEEIVFKNKENKQVYELLTKLVALRSKNDKAKGAALLKAKKEYEEYFNFLVGRFGYIAEIHTRRYIKFSNYQDLLQEGYLGLVMALDKFDMTRSNNFFRIANWYVKTRVKRAANKFDVINVPMAIGKTAPLCRVEVPIIADATMNAQDMMENLQQSEVMKNTIMSLPLEHKKVVCYFYGFDFIDNEIQMVEKKTIADIARELNISRPKIKKIIENTNKKFDSAI